MSAYLQYPSSSYSKKWSNSEILERDPTISWKLDKRVKSVGWGDSFTKSAGTSDFVQNDISLDSFSRYAKY